MTETLDVPPGAHQIELHPEQVKFLENTTLFNNLRIYISRYPKDKDRMCQLVLREIQTNPKLSGFEVVPPDPSYLARFCFIVNLPSPEAWNEAFKLWKSDQYFYIESNADALALLFQTRDLTHYLMAQNFHFFVGYQGEDVIAPLQFFLRQTIYAGKLQLSQILSPALSDGIEEKYVLYGQTFNEILRKTVDHIYFNFGHIDDSIEGLKATFLNSSQIATSGGVTELENIHEGKPIVVVGAGPSLDSDLELLSLNQDKYIIVAVDAAVAPLLKANCRVDYVSTIERYNGFQEKFFEGLPQMPNTDLVCYPVVHPDVIKCWPGITRFVYRNYAWFAYFEKNWPLGILESGGSASHLAARLALHLGASQVILVGCDMTYEEEETDGETVPRYRSHCRNTVYEEWDRYKTEEEIKSAIEFFGFHEVDANDGSLVKTNIVYHQWSKEYASMLIKPEFAGRILTTSSKGIKTPYLQFLKLSEVVKVLPVIDTSKKSPQNNRAMAPLTHEVLIKNIEGIYDLVTGCLTQINYLLAHPEKKVGEAVRVIRECLYGKLAYDILFTAFFIQNSAMEFFRSEGKYFMAPDGDFEDEHYEQRLWGLYWIFSVLENIGKKTLIVLHSEQKERSSDSVL